MLRPTSVAALLAAAAALPVGSRLQFAPDEGSEVTKTFTTELSLSYDILTSKMDGTDVPQEFLPEFVIEIDESAEVVVTDRIESLGEGRPAVLLRTFDTARSTYAEEFSMTPPPVEESKSGDVESDLEGHTVRFEWADGEYARSFEGDEGDAALLEDLFEDMDLRGFLPATPEVEDGDRWTVPAAAFASLLQPGGVALEREDNEWADGEPGEPEGELDAQLVRVLELDGARVAEISLEGEVTVSIARETDLAHVPVVDGTATESATTTYEVHGHVWWDLDAGRAHSYELEAGVEMAVRTIKDAGQPGPEFESTMEFVGSWSGRMQLQRPD